MLVVALDDWLREHFESNAVALCKMMFLPKMVFINGRILLLANLVFGDINHNSHRPRLMNGKNTGRSNLVIQLKCPGVCSDKLLSVTIEILLLAPIIPTEV